jgi:hypothetical protein
VNIDPTQTRCRQSTSFDHGQDFAVVAGLASRQSAQKTKDLVTFAQVAASQFSDHERVGDDSALFQARRQGRMSASQMLDPERSVD